jgi:hypothetical protein
LWLLYGKRQLEAMYDRAQRDPSGGFMRSCKVTWAEFAEFSGAGLNALLTDRSGGRRWIDHSPDCTPMVDLLADMFPGAQFVHILRDGRSSVHSMVNFLKRYGSTAEGAAAWKQFGPAWAKDFETACRTWSKYVLLASDFCRRHPDRTLTVRYEQLESEPGRVFYDVLRFLGETPMPAPAKFVKTNRINSSFQKDPRARPPRSGPREIWDAWTPAERTTFATLAGDVLRELCGVADTELRPAATSDAG